MSDVLDNFGEVQLFGSDMGRISYPGKARYKLILTAEVNGKCHEILHTLLIPTKDRINVF